MYARYFKRLMDVILSGIALVVLAPIIGIVALLVKLRLGSPVIFKQERPGKDEKVFTMYKFRTMTDERDTCGNLMPDSIRLTKFGKFLRSTSLDELPELWNIFRGDMSIVGPRPLLVSYLPYYTQNENRRHNVRPGLTGLAQVSGRNLLIWDERLAKDVEYVENITFTRDCKIILLTVRKVVFREDISTDTGLVETNLAKERMEKGL